jgi:hypothetical protein
LINKDTATVSVMVANDKVILCLYLLSFALINYLTVTVTVTNHGRDRDRDRDGGSDLQLLCI